MCLLALGPALFLQLKPGRVAAPETRFFGADNPNFRYTGRISFSDPKLPRFWAPGAYVQAKFRGPSCDVVINDENLWGKSHNSMEIAVDDRAPVRVQTTGKTNTFRVADGLSDGFHTLTICKDTEAGIGYVEFVGLRAAGLGKAPKLPARKLEFYGDSITAGMGSDTSVKACGAGEWYDQHNAYMSYGPTTARLLNARWQLTAQSGIGIIHSCCDLKVTMPDTWDKADRENKLPWDFERYQSDAVMVNLGQNDGAQNAEKFRATYIDFLHKLRGVYPSRLPAQELEEYKRKIAFYKRIRAVVQESDLYRLPAPQGVSIWQTVLPDASRSVYSIVVTEHLQGHLSRSGAVARSRRERILHAQRRKRRRNRAPERFSIDDDWGSGRYRGQRHWQSGVQPNFAARTRPLVFGNPRSQIREAPLLSITCASHQLNIQIFESSEIQISESLDFCVAKHPNI